MPQPLYSQIRGRLAGKKGIQQLPESTRTLSQLSEIDPATPEVSTQDVDRGRLIQGVQVPGQQQFIPLEKTPIGRGGVNFGSPSGTVGAATR